MVRLQVAWLVYASGRGGGVREVQHGDVTKGN